MNDMPKLLQVLNKIGKQIVVVRSNVGVLVLTFEIAKAFKKGKITKPQTYSPFFGNVQRVFFNDTVLTLCKIYEKSNTKYHPDGLYSVPEILKILKSQNLVNRNALINGMIDIGYNKHNKGSLEKIADQKLVEKFINHINQSIPEETNSPLKELVTQRNKRLAHYEKTQNENIPGTSINDINKLTEWAEKFVGIVFQSFSEGYLNIYDNYPIGEIETCTKRLLRDLGIVDLLN